MRSRKASVSYGILIERVRLSHQTLVVAVMAIVGLWLVSAFVQQLSLNRSLSQQAAQLRDQNAAISSTNDGYSRDIQAASSGAGAEEEARNAGYARSDENLYIVTTPPPPTATPQPRRAAARSSDGPLQALWRLVTGHG